ncbi:MAG: FtsQ-type POTRA domain-containing protein [Deltaproteobacteria bacterium]|nr:FtsQ-type POTRA domain-containing protein [Deltaproteobacteria bacterium]
MSGRRPSSRDRPRTAAHGSGPAAAESRPSGHGRTRGVNERVEAAAPGEEKAARRRSWRRTLGFALAVSLPAILGLGAIGAVALAADRATNYLDRSSGFRVERIEVVGHERLTEGEVLARAGLAAGASIFDVDIRRAREQLLTDPWIIRAFVEKEMPATVQVRIVERRPIAVLTGSGPLYLVGEDASLIATSTAEETPDLPVLTGFDLDRQRTDPVGLQGELEAAVDLLRLVDEVGLPGRRSLSEVHRSVRGGFDLIAADGLVVHLGPGPYRSKLRRLAESSAALAERSLTPAEIFLPGVRHPNRVGVRLGP